jgi:hypothetical protein
MLVNPGVILTIGGHLTKSRRGDAGMISRPPIQPNSDAVATLPAFTIPEMPRRKLR